MSEGSGGGGAGTAGGYAHLNSDHSICRAHPGWVFLETLAPKETLETG